MTKLEHHFNSSNARDSNPEMGWLTRDHTFLYMMSTLYIPSLCFPIRLVLRMCKVDELVRGHGPLAAKGGIGPQQKQSDQICRFIAIWATF